MTVAQTCPTPSSARREIPVAARESWWTTPDGTRLRRIDWPAPQAAHARGSILFMPGRGDAYEKWLETLDEWHGEGWEVTSADWRGQALSGRLGGDALTGHIDDFSIWINDLVVLWDEWRARTPGPHVLVAHSMGGHLALRAVAEGKVRPDALVLSAPMLGLRPDRVPSFVLHQIAKVMVRFGDPRRAAWSGDEKPELVHRARNLLLTHDASRYEDEQFWRRERPAITMGAASWGWIERALDSIRGLEKAGALEAVQVPVLLLGTTRDRLVSWRAIARAAKRLPGGKLVAFGPECRHEILRELDPVRERALAEIRKFLDRVAPACR
ncbi:alpha/beta hydrolase [Novosphingobium sp. PP1Y]|uniref:alpha/beta hydrolase n=1 Tax=Novosphingobium sp. PP1Y TaxID=702113 RepID=UPI00020EED4C|nr:alpha/beta hydrolase [Novosphingobium sp. PP1Y]CCA92797.1 lysophospholipase L2 [Novosphingobium sp. PP1Y]